MGEEVFQSFRDLLSSVVLCILLEFPILTVILLLVCLAAAPKWINESME